MTAPGARDRIAAWIIRLKSRFMTWRTAATESAGWPTGGRSSCPSPRSATGCSCGWRRGIAGSRAGPSRKCRTRPEPRRAALSVLRRMRRMLLSALGRRRASPPQVRATHRPARAHRRSPDRAASRRSAARAGALGYRNKISLKPVPSGAAGSAFGYTRREDRSVLPIESCPIARPELNAKLAELRASGEAARWPSRGPETDKLVLRRSASGEVLAFRIPPETLLTEKVLDRPLRVPAGGFFQVNPPVLDRLAAWLRDAHSGLAVETLVDGYCGCGVFALCLAEFTAGEVIGIESDPASIRCAEENALAAGLQRCKFIAGAVEATWNPR